MLLLNAIRKSLRAPAAFGDGKPLMPSRFRKLAIEPERIQAMQIAFYRARAELGLPPTPDRTIEILVTKTIDLCAAGERDPDRLCEIVVAYFRAEEPGHG
jgi:hypothetical protein